MFKTVSYIILLFNIYIFSQVVSSSKIIIKGYVFDDKTEEKLPRVLLSIDGNGTAVTDESGFFSFTASQGEHTIEASCIGYEKLQRQISIEKNIPVEKIFLRLVPIPIEIPGVTVSGERFKKEINTSTYELLPGDLSKIPQVGEPDVFRALQALPGVGEINDLGSQIFLRGGNFDEVLISLDDVPLYNPYHVGETFGDVNPDIIQLERLYPSNYPSNYGGYLSGVLDMQTKNYNETNLKGKFSLGLTSSKLYAVFPLWKGTLLLSGRRSYFDMLEKLTGKDFPYYFYDLYGKYIFPVDSKNLLELSFLYSKDAYNIFSDSSYKLISEKNNPNWGNLLYNFKYSHFFNEKSILNLQVYLSRSYLKADSKAYYLLGKIKPDSISSILINNTINEFSIKTGFEFQFPGQHLLTGIEVKKTYIKYGWDINEGDFSGLLKFPLQEVFFDFAPNPYSFKDNAFVYNHYAMDKIQINKKLEITPGYRLSYLSKVKKLLFAPYLLINYSFNKDFSTRLSLGRYYQYLYTIKDQRHQELYAPFSSYFISDNIDQVAFSYHFLAGLQIKDLFNFFTTEAEAYYKIRENLSTSYKNGSYSFENGYAAGMDIILKKDIGDFTGWIGYSLTRSTKKNDVYTYFSNYDRTHNFKLLINYQIFEHWTLSSFWSYASGLPATPIIGKYVRATNYYNNDNNNWIRIDNEGRQWVFLEGKENSTRLSDYNRLDLGFTGTFLSGNFLIKPYLQVLNVLGSPNSYFYNPGIFDTNQKEGEERGSFIIPTIGVSVEF